MDSTPAPRSASDGLDSWVKLTGAVLAAATFIFGIYTYDQTTKLQIKQTEEEARRSEETRRIEATKPFLSKQLALFTEATIVAAIIATSDNQDEVVKARSRFMQLFWGELAMVERGSVAIAMQDFKAALDRNGSQKDLQPLALALAHACRDELGKAWGTDAWSRR